MVRKVLPPSSNTGAENTCGEGLRALVDWVRVTFFDLEPLQVIQEVLRMDPGEFVLVDRGRYGYRKSYQSENIVIYFEGIDEEMGVLLDMTGQGCRRFEASENFDSWESFFGRVLGLRVNVPRLDVAIDDFKGYFTMAQIDRKIDLKEVSSRFKDVQDKGRRSLRREDQRRGKTIQFGSRHSRICVRFYDKMAEQLDKGNGLPEGCRFWNRVEIEAKDERARVVAEWIAGGLPLGEVVRGILANYIRFLVPGQDSNRARWKTWRPWERFLNGVGRLRLAVDPRVKTLEESIEWVEKQVSKTLLKIIMAEDLDFIKKLVVNERVEAKLKRQDFLAIEEYRLKKEEARLRDQDERKLVNIL